MSRTVLKGRHFVLTHTVEPEGPHPTIPQDHYESSMIISVLIRGSGTVYVEGNGYPFQEGDAIAIGLGELHSFHFEQTGPHERVTMYFTSALLSPFWEYDLDLMKVFAARQPGTGNRYSRQELEGGGAAEIFAKLCRLVEENQAECSATAEAYGHLLVMQLLFLLGDCCDRRGLPKAPHGNDSVIWEICRYIQENLTEDLSYDQLQRRFHVGRHYLSVLFRQNTGLTLTEFILQKRLMRVSELVADGWPVSKAAEGAGFRNYSHFYKVFVKRKGISPQKYYASGAIGKKKEKRGL